MEVIIVKATGTIIAYSPSVNMVTASIPEAVANLLSYDPSFIHVPKPSLQLGMDPPVIIAIHSVTVTVPKVTGTEQAHAPAVSCSCVLTIVKVSGTISPKVPVPSITDVYAKLIDVIVDSGPEIDKGYDLKVETNQEIDRRIDFLVYDDTLYNKALTQNPMTYPGATEIPIAILTCDAYYKQDWGGALIGGIPLSDLGCFLVDQTEIEIIGAINNRTVAVPGRNGVLFLNYSVDRPNITLLVHAAVEEWDDSENPMDLVMLKVNTLLQLLNPAKGPIDIVFEAYPGLSFKVLQTSNHTLNLGMDGANIRIPMTIVQNLDQS